MTFSKDLPDWIYYICGFYLIIVGVFGVAVNSFVVFLFIKCKKELVCLIGIPVTASSALVRDWDMTGAVCDMAGFLMTTLGMVTMSTLASLSLWRLLIIKFPGKLDGWVVSRCLVLVCWLWSLLLSCPPLVGWGHYTREHGNNISCSPDWYSDSAGDRSYNLYLFSLGFLLPLAIIISTSAAALAAVRNAVQAIENEEIKQTASLRQRKIIRMVLLLAGSFILCWTPYAGLAVMAILGLSHSVREHSNPLVTLLPHQLAKSSVLWNSVILIILNPQIRREAENFVPHLLRRPSTEDDHNSEHLPMVGLKTTRRDSP